MSRKILERRPIKLALVVLLLVPFGLLWETVLGPLLVPSGPPVLWFAGRAAEALLGLWLIALLDEALWAPSRRWTLLTFLSFHETYIERDAIKKETGLGWQTAGDLVFLERKGYVEHRTHDWDELYKIRPFGTKELERKPV